MSLDRLALQQGYQWHLFHFNISPSLLCQHRNCQKTTKNNDRKKKNKSDTIDSLTRFLYACVYVDQIRNTAFERRFRQCPEKNVVFKYSDEILKQKTTLDDVNCNIVFLESNKKKIFLTELMVSDSPIRKQSRIRSCDFFYTLLVVVVAVVIIYSSTRFIFLVN